MPRSFPPESKIEFLAEAYALFSVLILGFIKATHNSTYIDFSLTHIALIVEVVIAPLVLIVAFLLSKVSIGSVFTVAKSALCLFAAIFFLNLIALPVVLLTVAESALDEYIWAMGIAISTYYLVDRWRGK